MDSLFSASFFAGNRARLRQLFTGTAPVVVTANGLLQRGGDTTFPFAQDAVFWYLTGIDEPDITLVMDKDQEYLLVPSRSNSRETFDGAVDLTGLSTRSGIRDIYDESEGWDKLKSRLKKVKHVATIASPGAYIEQHGFYTNPARAALAEKLQAQQAGIQLLDIGPHIVKLRSVKQAPELAAIKRAIDITADSIKNLSQPALLRTYSNEYQIEAELTKGIRLGGASGHAFSPIVAGGERACTLHNVANDGELKKGDLVIIDTGAEVEHYASDITRTIALGPPTKRQKDVHSAVQAVQDFAFGLIKPGLLLKEYEKQVEDYMGRKLQELGLIKTIGHESVRRYFPHATSHFMGLNVHDIGDYSSPLEAGAVITVEPGIYIPQEGIGVRIEDDVLITPEGHEILSANLPRELNIN